MNKTQTQKKKFWILSSFYDEEERIIERFPKFNNALEYAKNLIWSRGRTDEKDTFTFWVDLEFGQMT